MRWTKPRLPWSSEKPSLSQSGSSQKLGSFLSPLLGGFLASACGSCEKAHVGLCLLPRIALLHISLVGCLVGLEGASFLDCVEG